jgi:hypothetical protein
MPIYTMRESKLQKSYKSALRSDYPKKLIHLYLKGFDEGVINNNSEGMLKLIENTHPDLKMTVG